MSISSNPVIHTIKAPLSSAVKRPQDHHVAPVAKVALSSSNLSGDARETVATYVGYQQQQALLQTAQKAFAQDESEPNVSITGEIAAEAAKQQTKQALAFTAIEKVNEKLEQRPSIQTKA